MPRASQCGYLARSLSPHMNFGNFSLLQCAFECPPSFSGNSLWVAPIAHILVLVVETGLFDFAQHFLPDPDFQSFEKIPYHNEKWRTARSSSTQEGKGLVVASRRKLESAYFKTCLFFLGYDTWIHLLHKSDRIRVIKLRSLFAEMKKSTNINDKSFNLSSREGLDVWYPFSR